MLGVVALVDGCPEIEAEIASAPAKVREYIKQEFDRLLENKLFLMGLEGHLRPDVEGKERLERCLNIMRRIRLL